MAYGRRVAGLLAAAAAAQQVVTPLRDFTVSCPATYVWDDETLSGGGHLFEYYHFLIDFAPRVLEAFEANGEECEDITILAPQKLSGGKRVFLVELNEAASMRGQLAAVFEPQHRITVELWQGHGKDPLPEVLDGRRIGSPDAESWSAQPRYRFDRFRSRVLADAKVHTRFTGSPPPASSPRSRPPLQRQRLPLQAPRQRPNNKTKKRNSNLIAGPAQASPLRLHVLQHHTARSKSPPPRAPVGEFGS